MGCIYCETRHTRRESWACCKLGEADRQLAAKDDLLRRIVAARDAKNVADKALMARLLDSRMRESDRVAEEAAADAAAEMLRAAIDEAAAESAARGEK